MERLRRLLQGMGSPEETFLRNQEMGGELDQAVAQSAPRELPPSIPMRGEARMPEQAPMPEAYSEEPTVGIMDRLKSALMPSEEPQGRRDFYREELESQSGLGHRLKNSLVGGLAGLSGRGIGEIANAQQVRDNASLREAQAKNLRDPGSQISEQFRSLAKMYDPQGQFALTENDSAGDIIEAMPWLAQKIGIDLKGMSRGGSGGGGIKKRPLGEKAEEEIANQSNTIEYADYLIDKIKSNPDLVGKATSTLQKGISKIPFANFNDPNWIELEGQIKAFTKAYLKSMEGARPSDFDSVSYERITGNQFNSPEELQRLIANLKQSSERGRKYRLEMAGRNNKDISGFEDMVSAPREDKKPKRVRMQANGKTYEIPESEVKAFMKDYPKAKRL